MAIESFGESLLTKQRERQKKQERKDMRTAALTLAGTVGIGLYRKNIKKKQEEFFNNQAVRQNRVNYQNALKDSDYFKKLEEQGKAHTGGLRAYLRDTIAIPEARRRIYASQDEESFDPDSLGSAVNSYADSFLDDLEKNALAGIAKANAMGDLESYDKDVNLKANLPNSVAAAGAAKIFGKKNLDQINQDAIERVSKSTFNQDAEAMKNLRSLFSQGLEVRDAENLALDIQKRMEKVKRREGKLTESIKSVETTLSNGQVKKIDMVVVTEEDYKGNKKIISSTPVEDGPRLVEREITEVDTFGNETIKTVFQAVDIGGRVTGEIENNKKSKVLVRASATTKVPPEFIDLAKQSLINLEGLGNELIDTLKEESEKFDTESGVYLDGAYAKIAFRGGILSKEYGFSETEAMQISAVSQINDLKRENSIFNTASRDELPGLQILDGIAQINYNPNPEGTDIAIKRRSVNLNDSQLTNILKQVEQEILSKQIKRSELQDVITDEKFMSYAKSIKSDSGTVYDALASYARVPSQGASEETAEAYSTPAELSQVDQRLSTLRSKRTKGPRSARRGMSKEEQNLRRYKELLSEGFAGTKESMMKAVENVENARTRRDIQAARRKLDLEQELYKLTEDIFGEYE